MNPNGRALAMKNRERNSSAPIMRIPPEILVKIFVYYQNTFFLHWNPEEWIKVTHVCHFFRQVALASPTLWSRIDFRSGDQTKTYLRGLKEYLLRSKQAPLTVFALSTSSPAIRAQQSQFLACEMHRIRDLELNVGSRSYLPVASGAPQLRNLTLTLAGSLQYDMRELFGELGAPNLEVLMVNHCTGLSLDVVSFPRTLRAIILPSFSPGPIPPMAELLQVFEQLPILESLYFDLPPARSQILSYHTLSLSSLTLTGTTPCIASFLSHIVVPKLSRLRADIKHTNQAELNLLAHILSARLSDNPSPSPLVQFSVAEMLSGSIQLKGLSSIDANRGSRVMLPPDCPMLFIGLDLNHLYDLHIVPAFVALLPIFRVQTLFIQINSGLRSAVTPEDLEVWLTAFSLIHALSALHVVDDSRAYTPWEGTIDFYWREPEPRKRWTESEKLEIAQTLRIQCLDVFPSLSTFSFNGLVPSSE